MCLNILSYLMIRTSNKHTKSIASVDKPCISLACGILDITSILHYLLIYMFLGFHTSLPSSLLSCASCALALLSCALPHILPLSHALPHTLPLSCALCCIPAPSGTSAHSPMPHMTFPCSPSVVVPLSFMFHLCTLVPRPLSTFFSI